MSKPVLVLLVSEPVELARLHHLASPYLPVGRGSVVSSRMVAGLEGVAALSWIDGVDDIEDAIKLLEMVSDLARSLKWSYRQKVIERQNAARTAMDQKTMF